MKKFNEFVNERLKLNKDSKLSTDNDEISRDEFLEILKNNDIMFDDSRHMTHYWDIYLKGSELHVNWAGQKTYVPSIYTVFLKDFWRPGASVNYENHKKCIYITTRCDADSWIREFAELKNPDMYDESKNYFKYTKHNAKELIRILIYHKH